MLIYQMDIGQLPHRAVGGVSRPASAAEVQTMVLVTVLALLALFSLISILLGSEDGREAPGGTGRFDPASNIVSWMIGGGHRA